MATAAAVGHEKKAARIGSRRVVAGLAPFLFIALAALVIALAALGARLLADDDGSTVRRDEVLTYQQAVHPLTVEWGKIEILGMRPAIGDLREEGGVPDEAIVVEARQWQATLADLRAQLAAVTPPPALERASALFDDSIAGYIDAARIFEAAASATGDIRERGIVEGIERVRAATKVFNEAALVLQDVRKRIGLGLTDDFPKEPAGEGTT